MSDAAGAQEWAMPTLPPGRPLPLPGRGTTWILDQPGPPGAPTVLLLHGWMATAALNWFTAFEPLGRHYRVVAMDVRGHGRGIRSRRPFRLVDCADDAAAVCEQLGIAPVIAVGYSMGGPIAQLLWARHPGCTRGLVMCATAAVFASPVRGPRWPGGVYPVRSAVRAAGRGAAIGLSFVPADAQRRVTRRVVRDRLRATPLEWWAADERSYSDAASLVWAGLELGRYDGRELLAGVDVPVAVVETLQDRVVSPRRQEQMAATIPGAHVFPIPADHGACVEHPRMFTGALTAACQDVAARAAAATAAGTHAGHSQ